MLYVKFAGNIPVEASYDPPKDKETIYETPATGKQHKVMLVDHDVWQTRNDWKSYAQVCKIARLLEATTGIKYLGVDEGSHTSPRYDVIEPPKVGDAVSYGFNGDYYPDGYITKISKTFQVTTDQGHRYLRRRNTSRWVRTGGTWTLVQGHRSELNPSF